MIRMNKLQPHSFVDGPGDRAVIFFQGCPLACKGCQNRALWGTDGGRNVSEDAIAATLLMWSQNVTISGGEPFAQPEALAHLVIALRNGGAKSIIVYTGYTWDQLMTHTHPAYPYMKYILSEIDVLVDGPFVKALDHNLINYRGSSNQRPIDVQASLDEGEIILLDWDVPMMTVTQDGDLVLPVGLAMDFAETGSIEKSRMCGQTRELQEAQA